MGNREAEGGRGNGIEFDRRTCELNLEALRSLLVSVDGKLAKANAGKNMYEKSEKEARKG
jgi:hypothetical protein